jgi:hypothetical protein
MEDHQQPPSLPTEHPVFDGPLPASPAPKNSKTLAIALVVSALLLVAAGVIAYWIMTKASSTTTLSQPAGDGSGSVKKVTIVPPALPAAYVKRDESTVTAQITFYDDAAAACGLSTAVLPASVSKSAKEVVLAHANANKDTGITTTNNTDGSHYTIADTSSSHTYDFSSVALNQDVALPGVTFTKQTQLIAYKQFGSQVASIGIWCKADAWEGKKAELESLLKTFKVTTQH